MPYCCGFYIWGEVSQLDAVSSAENDVMEFTHDLLKKFLEGLVVFYTYTCGQSKGAHGERCQLPTAALYMEQCTSIQRCILPPCPQGHGQGGFLSRKKIHERLQSNATFLFSKIKWKTCETDKSYLCLPQQVKRVYLNSRAFFLAHSGLLRKGSEQLFSHKDLLKFSKFSIEILQRIWEQGQECLHKLHNTPPSQWLESEVQLNL